MGGVCMNHILEYYDDWHQNWRKWNALMMFYVYSQEYLYLIRNGKIMFYFAEFEWEGFQ